MYYFRKISIPQHKIMLTIIITSNLHLDKGIMCLVCSGYSVSHLSIRIPCSCCTKSYLQNALFMAFNLSGLLSSTCATSSLGEVTFSVSKLYD